MADTAYQTWDEGSDDPIAGVTLSYSIKVIQTVSALGRNTPFEFCPEDPASKMCVHHV